MEGRVSFGTSFSCSKKESKFLINMFPRASKEKLHSLGLHRANRKKGSGGPIKGLPVTGRAPSSHGSTSLPPESLNKRIVSDDSLSRKIEEYVKEKYKTHKNNIKMCA